MSRTQFSSFQIARMLNVSRQAVNQWIDKGYIISYRTPGGHRRVSREDLISFLEARNIPIPTDLKEGKKIPDEGPEVVRIILIDDDADFMMLLSEAMAEAAPGSEIRRFTSGLDGLIAIGSAVPDLLLLDLKMPGLDGVEVVERIRSNELTAGLPVIVVTSHDVKIAAGKLVKMKVAGILPKQLGLSELTQKILDLYHAYAAAAN